MSTHPADKYWQRQYREAEQAAEPLTARERELLRLQKANPGPLRPELAAIQLARQIEQQRRQQADTYDQPFAVQDPIHNPDETVLARRGRLSRRLSRHLAADPHMGILRPGPSRSGPHPWDDEPECIEAPAGWWR